MPPPPSPVMAGGTEAPAPVRNPFPFQHKPNTLDRDRIVVPAGWDSWGKIAVLREGFDAKTWGEAWERDLEEAEGQGSGEAGAKKLFAALVPDQGEKVGMISLSSILAIDTLYVAPRLTSNQQPNAGADIPTQALRREFEEGRQRSSCFVPKSDRPYHRCSSRYRWTPWQQ